PQLPPKTSPLCSAGSLVLHRCPTPLKRTYLNCGCAPSQTGLDLAPTEAFQRSPGSRACCFSACLDSWTTQDRATPRDYRNRSLCLPQLGESRHPERSSFRSSIVQAHRYLCLRFNRHLAMSPARLEARMDSLFSFPVGLFHPLQHAGFDPGAPKLDVAGSIP